jgi:peptidoglycan/LPS O-acetylase OafA/YrhL
VLDTNFLRFFAIILIINSHLEHFYPISLLAADGFLGNSLFFALSGVGLALSKSNQQLRFGTWFWRRLTRIYPSLLLVVLIFLIVLDNRWDGSALGLIKLAIWPTQFGFLSQLLVFYIPYYFVAKLSRARFKALFIGLFVPLVATYFFSFGTGEPPNPSAYLHPLNEFNTLFYFQMMVLGGWLAKEVSENNALLLKLSQPANALMLSLGAMFIYLAIKAAILLKLLNTAYFLLHVSTIALVISLFIFSMSIWIKYAFANKLANQSVLLISGLTLELYLVHVCLLDYSIFTNIFPVNIVLFVAISVVGAWLVNAFSTKAQLLLRQLKFST